MWHTVIHFVNMSLTLFFPLLSMLTQRTLRLRFMRQNQPFESSLFHYFFILFLAFFSLSVIQTIEITTFSDDNMKCKSVCVEIKAEIV